MVNRKERERGEKGTETANIKKVVENKSFELSIKWMWHFFCPKKNCDEIRYFDFEQQMGLYFNVYQIEHLFSVSRMDK